MKKMSVSHCCIFIMFLFIAACRPVAVPTTSPPPADFEIVATTGTAVVITDLATLRLLPDILSDHVATLERDTHLTVVGKLGDESWYQVEVPEREEAVVWVELPAGITAVWIDATFVTVTTPDALPTPGFTATHTLLPTITPTITGTATAAATPDLTTTPCVLPTGWTIYIVRSGDTLNRIARAVGSTPPQLMVANCLVDDLIFAGQRLHVPRLPPQSPDPPTATATLASPHTPTPTEMALPTATATATLASPDLPTPTNTSLPPPPPPPDTPTATLAPPATPVPTPSPPHTNTPVPTATASPMPTP